MVSTRVKNKAIKNLILSLSIAHIEITNILIQGQRVPIYMKKRNAIGSQNSMLHRIVSNSQKMDIPHTLNLSNWLSLIGKTRVILKLTAIHTLKNS